MNSACAAATSSRCCSKTMTTGGWAVWPTARRDTFWLPMWQITVSAIYSDWSSLPRSPREPSYVFFHTVGNLNEGAVQSSEGRAASSDGTVDRSTPTRVRWQQRNGEKGIFAALTNEHETWHHTPLLFFSQIKSALWFTVSPMLQISHSSDFSCLSLILVIEFPWYSRLLWFYSLNSLSKVSALISSSGELQFLSEPTLSDTEPEGTETKWVSPLWV